MLAILLGASGCGSGNAANEKPEPPDRATELVGTKTTAEPAPNSEPLPAKSKTEEPAEAVAVTKAMTEEERKAAEAFQAMTAEGVSPEDIDAATKTLLTLGASAIPVLAAGLQSDETLSREMAATIFAQMGAGAADASEELVAALKDESVFVRANAATALAQMDGHADVVVPVFTEFLEGDDEHLRRMAAMNLTVLDDSAVKPLTGKLTEALEIDDREVRLAIVELLGRIGPDAREAVDAIKQLDATDDPELQTAVTAALLQIEEKPGEG